MWRISCKGSGKATQPSEANPGSENAPPPPAPRLVVATPKRPPPPTPRFGCGVRWYCGWFSRNPEIAPSFTNSARNMVSKWCRISSGAHCQWVSFLRPASLSAVLGILTLSLSIAEVGHATCNFESLARKRNLAEPLQGFEPQALGGKAWTFSLLRRECGSNPVRHPPLVVLRFYTPSG